MLRRSLATLTCAVVLFAPVSAFARQVSDIVDVSAQTIQRSTFITWSFSALSLPKKDVCTLPYTRTPKGLVSTLCAAQDKGALTAFGTAKVYPLNKAITRGEAIQVLSALTGLNGDADVSKFSDVKTEAEKRAVRNAVANKWMVPLRATMFGLDKPLTGVEALSLLQAVAGQSPISQKVTITVNGTPASSSGLPKEQLMKAVWELIERDYLNSDKLTEEEAGYAAAEALVKSLKDPYSVLFRPPDATGFTNQFKGEVSGIGANIESKEGVVTILSPIPGSPAERAGLQPGDQILGADDKDFKGMSLDEAVSYIRGPKGSYVELKVRRSGVDMNVRIQRDTITIPEVKVSWQGNVAIVQLMQFGETTLTKIRPTFVEIQKKNPRGIILDLRNNPGGLLNAADVVVSNFVPKGSVVAHVTSKSQTTDEITQDEPTINADVKVVVLVNNGSASASEIVAGALQDHERATVVGVQTFGKGSVQEVITFRSGELLKLTIAHYFTPDNHAVDGVGITPDVIVDGEERTQLDRALGLLR